MNLFIIGTGFDKAHNVPGMYKDFRKYVASQEAPSYYLERREQPELDGFQTYTPENAVDALTCIISETGEDDQWNDFERTLGKLNFISYLSCRSNLEDEQQIREYNQETLEKFKDSVETLKTYFEEWIKKIPIQAVKKSSFEKLISPADAFLIFNYTDTLEKTYGIKENIFHIHGKTGEKIIFGHGDSNYNFEFHEKDYPGCEVGLSEIKARLRKRTEEVLKGNVMQNFIKCISSQNVDNVYSFGFSYSDVDLVYMEEICKHLKPTVTWLFNDFDDADKRKTYEEKLKKYGFAGTFSSFHID